MLTIKVHEFAAYELDEAIKWYDVQLDGLGSRFKEVVISQIKKIANNPDWFPKEVDNIYKAYTPKFPYKILFSFDKKELVIWAIAHLHRKPQYWEPRTI